MRIRIVDVETAGDPDADDRGVCEIGFWDLIAHGTDLVGQPTEWGINGSKGAHLTNPGCAIGALESAIHHITDDMVRNKPFWPDTAEVVMRPIDDIEVYAGHGIQTELEFLGKFAGEKKWIDTWKCALHCYPDAPAHSNQALKYYVKAAGVMDTMFSLPAHRAGPDAYVTAHLLRDMLNFHASLEQLIQWSAEPALLRWCRIGKWREMNGGRGARWEEVDSGFLNWMLDPTRTFTEDQTYTARYHLDKREMDQREEREQLALERQLQDNGLSDKPAEAKDIANDNGDLFKL